MRQFTTTYRAGLICLGIALMSCLVPLSSQAATKTATSATINIMADDYYDIYINGNKLAQPACATNGLRSRSTPPRSRPLTPPKTSMTGIIL